ncbi:MAG: porin [Alphaproteobacteria bacterium]|nr:porin [Alphaproteobacteria bacterium]
MKKALIGSTALVAAGLLGSGGAFAADPIKLGVFGNFRVQAGYVTQSDSSGEVGFNHRNFGFGQDSQIQFRGSTKLDNGITVGVQIELEGEAGITRSSQTVTSPIGTTGTIPGGGLEGTGETDVVDEAYMWIENTAVWGRIELGNRDPAGNKMAVRQPFVLGTSILGAETMQAVSTPPGQQVGFAGSGLIAPGTQDANKITYYTPRFFNGLQLGVSYTPDVTENNGRFGVGYARTDRSAAGGVQGDVISVGFNYTNKVGVANLQLSGSYDKGSQESTDTDTEDQRDWSLGVNISYQAWTFGGIYEKLRNSPNTTTITNKSDNIQWAVGVSYSWGAWLAGIEYYNGKAEVLTSAGVANGDDKLTEWGVSIRRTLGPGVTLGGGIRFYDWEDNANAAANENQATAIIVETALTF